MVAPWPAASSLPPGDLIRRAARTSGGGIAMASGSPDAHKANLSTDQQGPSAGCEINRHQHCRDRQPTVRSNRPPTGTKSGQKNLTDHQQGLSAGCEFGPHRPALSVQFSST